MTASTQRDHVRRHFDRAAAGYAEASRRWPWAWLRGRESRAVLELLGDLRGRTVLELGCGAGYYTRRLVDAGAARVVAVDLSPAMLAAAPAGPSVLRVRADAAQVALRAPAEVVLAAGLLEFVDDPVAVLANAHRLSTPGAPLVALVPSGGLAASGYRAFHRRHALSAHLFSETALRSGGAAAGWRLEASRAVWPFTLVARLRRVDG